MWISATRITWGLMLLWLGIMLIVDEGAGVASIGAGVIFLFGSLLRKRQGRRAGAFIPLVGVLLILMGVNDLNGDDKGIPFLATALVALGALLVVRAVTGPKVHRTRGMTITFGEPDKDR